MNGLKYPEVAAAQGLCLTAVEQSWDDNCQIEIFVWRLRSLFWKTLLLSLLLLVGMYTYQLQQYGGHRHPVHHLDAEGALTTQSAVRPATSQPPPGRGPEKTWPLTLSVDPEFNLQGDLKWKECSTSLNITQRLLICYFLYRDYSMMSSCFTS